MLAAWLGGACWHLLHALHPTGAERGPPRPVACTPCQVAMVPYQQIDVNAPFSAAFLDHGMAWAAKIVSLGAVLGERARLPCMPLPVQAGC